MTVAEKEQLQSTLAELTEYQYSLHRCTCTNVTTCPACKQWDKAANIRRSYRISVFQLEKRLEELTITFYETKDTMNKVQCKNRKHRINTLAKRIQFLKEHLQSN